MGRSVILLVPAVLYLPGLVYMSVIWHLASIVSELDEDYGLQAMAKSKDLIKGKLRISVIIFFILLCFQWFVLVLLQRLVVLRGGSVGIPTKIGYGILCSVVLSGCFLLGFTVQTVIYFVCKSYHHENINKSTLSDHLDVYHGEYVLL